MSQEAYIGSWWGGVGSHKLYILVFPLKYHHYPLVFRSSGGSLGISPSFLLRNGFLIKSGLGYVLNVGTEGCCNEF